MKETNFDGVMHMMKIETPLEKQENGLTTKTHFSRKTSISK